MKRKISTADVSVLHCSIQCVIGVCSWIIVVQSQLLSYSGGGSSGGFGSTRKMKKKPKNCIK